MSIAPDHFSAIPFVPCPPPTAKKGGKDPPQRLHRIAEVRKEQGVSLRTAARHLKTDVATVRQQEDAQSDLSVSELLRWQQILDVPLIDLLVDPSPQLSRPVLERARLVRLMKTAAAIRDKDGPSDVQRLAQMLVDQLIEVMPELAEVGAWHSVGQRRSLNEYGRVVERCVREDIFQKHQDD